MLQPTTCSQSYQMQSMVHNSSSQQDGAGRGSASNKSVVPAGCDLEEGEEHAHQRQAHCCAASQNQQCGGAHFQPSGAHLWTIMSDSWGTVHAQLLGLSPCLRHWELQHVQVLARLAL